MTREQINGHIDDVIERHFQVFFGQFQITKDRIKSILRDAWNEIDVPTEAKQTGNEEMYRISALNAGLALVENGIIMQLFPGRREQKMNELMQAHGWHSGNAFDLAVIAGVQPDMVQVISKPLHKEISMFQKAQRATAEA